MNLKRISKRLDELSITLDVDGSNAKFYTKEELGKVMQRVSHHLDKLKESIDEIIGEE